jgi:hypothetical protein
VALLPDALFFSRAIPVAEGVTAAEAAGQVELALEAIAPFPLPQLYYGWYWVPGATHAFVYAAYRRRFTTEQTLAWQGAELVLPVSATLFGAKVEPATTVVLGMAEEMIAVYWETPAVPAKVLFRPVPAEATAEERGRIREELLHAMGGTKTVIDLAELPVAEPARNDRELGFRAGELVSRVSRATASSLDVRDKGDLALLRNAQQRDVLLWRLAVGCAAALLVLGLGEVALVGSRAWNQVRVTQVNARKSAVDKIKASAELANRIDQLVNNRLLPFEMIFLVAGDKQNKRKPDEIWFTRISTLPASGLYTLHVEAQTTNTALIPVYESQLKAMKELRDVKVSILPGQGDRFQLTVKFNPEMLKPAPSA